MKDPRLLLRRLRRATLLISAVGLGYLLLRFDTLTLPKDGCSPVLRYRAGVPLLLDRWPDSLEVGDVVLFRDPGSRLHLGLVESLERRETDAEPRYWIGVDNPACPGTDSTQLGWIGQAEVRARVLFAWPF